MSVILKTDAELASLAKTIFSKQHIFKPLIEESAHYKSKTRLLSKTQNITEYAYYCWIMCNHLKLANQFAYCSQYKTSEIDHEVLDDDLGEVLSDVDFYSKLGSLYYNMVDNNGNMFVSPQYFDNFKKILEKSNELYEKEYKKLENVDYSQID